MMNGLETPSSPPMNPNNLGVAGGLDSVGASAHAHHLARMRVSKLQSPASPMTPVAAATPNFIAVTNRFGEENVMEDLQLAAELGKTLLERNRELESNIKHQNAVIEDQIQEIEYLSKQTAALREVNDSRLRIYEQLEISIQELEKNNQRLAAEGASDKRKIKGLCSNLEALEARCEELQKNLEEARTGAQQQRGRNRRRSIINDEQNLRRSHSCEHTIQEEEEEQEQTKATKSSEERAAEDLEARTRVEELQERLKETQNEKVSELRKREELEIQLACMTQENAVLQDQLNILREKEVTLRSFDDELASLDDSSCSRLCRKCLGNVDDTASNPALYDLQDSIEDTDVSIESIHGECALVKLKNGGYAWGSQESLASIGQVMSHVGSGGTSPGTEASDAPHNSLLSELDSSYRILIEKYEALLEAREHQQQQHQHPDQQVAQNTDLSHEGLIHPGVDDLSGPMSLVMTDAIHDTTLTMKCQHCNTCTCDLKPPVGRPKSNLEEFSEVETSSSGFSDGESRLSNKATQTDDGIREIFEDMTPTPTVASRCLDLSSPLNPCDNRFQAAPEYKKLFQEIFTVLKKTVDEKDTQTQPAKTPKSQKPEQENKEITNPVIAERESDTKPEEQKTSPAKTEVDADISKDDEQSKNIENSENTTKKIEESPQVPCDQKETKKMPSKKVESSAEDNGNTNTQEKPQSKEIILVPKDLPSVVFTQPKNNSGSGGLFENRDGNVGTQSATEEQRIAHKPPRPDSLDLGTSSRSSSRQKRRRRHHRIRLDSYQQQYQGQYQYTHGNQGAGHGQHQNQSGHGHQKRENQKPDDFPTLETQPEGEGNKTRIIYNSNRGRCEHHRSRKHRDRSNNRQNQRAQHHHQQNNQNFGEQRQNHIISQQNTGDVEGKSKVTTPKINYPSVEVAKLRKLEMTYAEALKASFNRSQYSRRY